MDMNLIYKSNSDYLQAEEIGQNMWTVVIKSMEVKEFDEGKSKLVLTFDGMDKTLPLNVTNARAISELYGPDTDGWINRQVMLFAMPVDFQGKTVMGIRIRAPQQQPAQPIVAGPAQPVPAQQIFTPQPMTSQPVGQPMQIDPNGPQAPSEANPPPQGNPIDDEIPF